MRFVFDEIKIDFCYLFVGWENGSDMHKMYNIENLYIATAHRIKIKAAAEKKNRKKKFLLVYGIEIYLNINEHSFQLFPVLQRWKLWHANLFIVEKNVVEREK